MRLEVYSNDIFHGAFDNPYDTALFVKAFMFDRAENAGEYGIEIRMQVIPEDTDIELFFNSLLKEEAGKETTEPEETASEAMEGMKAAVDSLQVPKKPKTEKRPKDRHEKILKLYNQGYTKAKMAEELGIGISTINYHIQKLRDEGKI